MDVDALKWLAGFFVLVSAVGKAVAASNGRWDLPPKKVPAQDPGADPDADVRTDTASASEEEKRKAKCWVDWGEAFAYAAGIGAAFVALLILTFPE